MTAIKIDKKVIEKRKNTLERARRALKRDFIGIDKIIDNLLDYIQVWYLMPEILTRPVIVNLWGMTGVGKTDLIRKLVKYLDYQDRFTEIELSNIDQSSWRSSVFSILQDNDLNNEQPGIVLFDEIQRFNTLDQEGKPMQQSKYADFWELLSDGRLSKKEKYDLDRYLFNFMAQKKSNERKRKKGEEVDEDDRYLNTWELRDFKRNLGSDFDFDTFSELSNEQLIKQIEKTKKKKKIYEPVDHSKTLIIISGNLDEAFRMATRTSEADIDADIFHAFTKKITMVDIKNALSRKFRPEQVARFGNIHLIYTSLKRLDFEKLIKREISRIIRSTKSKLGIELTIDKSLNELIYRNGVFPVQGVRPVFSSVIDILETNLSKYIFDAVMRNSKKIHIAYDHKKKLITAKVGSKKIETPYEGRIDKIRQANEADTVANISVHESGHAVVYMLLMGMAPLQMKSKIASSYASGFTFPHQIHETKENIINKIKIYLAGGVAEDIVFGDDNASIGRADDREQATRLAVDYVRKYGFDEEFNSVYTMDDYAYRLKLDPTDMDIEKMISRLLSETKELLIQNFELLKELSRELSETGSMDGEAMANVARQYGHDVIIKPEGYLHITNYHDKMQSH